MFPDIFSKLIWSINSKLCTYLFLGELQELVDFRVPEIREIIAPFLEVFSESLETKLQIWYTPTSGGQQNPIDVQAAILDFKVTEVKMVMNHFLTFKVKIIFLQYFG